MSIITNSFSGNSEIVYIYEWSIRKILCRHDSRYTTYLIGYVPSYHKLQITRVKRIHLEQRLVYERDAGGIYTLRGTSGLTDLAEDIWRDHKKIIQVTYEADITYKYKDVDDELYHKKLIARYGPYFYMFP